MLNNELINQISESLQTTIKSYSPLTGGDINEVYILESKLKKFVIKVNRTDLYPNMFETEMNGLLKLKKGNSIRIGNPIKVINHKGLSILILDHIKKGLMTKELWINFGSQLNLLHQKTQDKFGLNEANYIGCLHQSNINETSWANFYANQRLEPMLKMAINSGYLKGYSSRFEKLYSKLSNLFPEESPALLHGDLWSGNFIAGENNKVWLIDPAVYYGHREMDIGMTLLFGGFNKLFYESYNANNPLENEWKERIQLTQLYPLLVHVNLFGGEYVVSVKSAIDRFV